jgi:hypothetical protein
MATVAKLIDIFAGAGYRDPATDLILNGGKVTVYDAGTTNLATVWTDRAKTTPAAQPFILGSDGRAEVYGDNVYKFVITDSADAAIETIDQAEYRTFSDTIDEYVAHVDTIQDLRDYTGNATTIIVDGYSTIGDGCGGPERYKATGAAPGTYVDDGGLIIVPTGGDGSEAWLISTSLDTNVAWYGAIGDGVNDDTSAIQAAFDSGSTAICFPEGHFKVTSTIIYDVTVKLIYGAGGSMIVTGGNPSTLTYGTMIDGQLADTGNYEPNFIFKLDTSTVDGPAHPSNQVWRDMVVCDMRHDRAADPYGATATVGGWRNYADGNFGDPTKIGPKDADGQVWAPSGGVFDEYNYFENITMMGLKIGMAYEGFGHTFVHCHSRACYVHYDLVTPEQVQFLGCFLNFGRVGIRSNVRRASYAKNFQFIGGAIQRFGDNNSVTGFSGDPNEDGVALWLMATEVRVDTYYERNDTDVLGGDIVDSSNASRGLKRSTLMGNGTPFSTSFVTSDSKSANINLYASIGISIDMAWTKSGSPEDVYFVHANSACSGIDITFSGGYALTSSSKFFNLGGSSTDTTVTDVAGKLMYGNALHNFGNRGPVFNQLTTGDSETVESRVGYFRPASGAPWTFGNIALQSPVGVLFHDSHFHRICTTSSTDPTDSVSATTLISTDSSGDMKWETNTSGPVIKATDNPALKFRITVNAAGVLTAVFVP